MKVTVEFHGVLRRLAGQESALIELSGAPMVADVIEALEREVPELSAILETTACAVGDALVHRQSVLSDGDHLVLIPPVSGG